MKILGIETSCDETALSTIECSGDLASPQFKIINSVVNSQAKLHEEFGGVFPTLAKREHAKNIIPLLKELIANLPLLEDSDTPSLAKEGVRGRSESEIQQLLSREPGLTEAFEKEMPHIPKPDIDAIAVTQGPGLEPALWVGVNFAKALGLIWNLPVIPTHHMEGHIISVLLDKYNTVTFPALALLISGGHTQLVKVSAWGSYEIIGNTKDDAIGEAFDKVARILGLPYPGGPEISKLAAVAREKNLSNDGIRLPRPMLHSKDNDFSFSGIKTAALYLVQKLGGTEKLDEATKQLIAQEFENAVTEVIVKKTLNAAEDIGANTLIIGGGVVANKHIRNTFETKCKEKNITLLLPTHEVSTDNALMIAAAGYIKYLQNNTPEKDFKASGNLSF